MQPIALVLLKGEMNKRASWYWMGKWLGFRINIEFLLSAVTGVDILDLATLVSMLGKVSLMGFWLALPNSAGSLKSTDVAKSFGF